MKHNSDIKTNPLRMLADLVRGSYNFDSIDRVAFISILIFLKRFNDLGYTKFNKWHLIKRKAKNKNIIERICVYANEIAEFIPHITLEEIARRQDEDKSPDSEIIEDYWEHEDTLNQISKNPGRFYPLDIIDQLLAYLDGQYLTLDNYDVLTFSEMYIDFLEYIFTIRENQSFNTSKIVRKLIVELSIRNQIKTVADLFCGTGSLLAEIKNKHALLYPGSHPYVFGQDINNDLMAIANANLSFSAGFNREFTKPIKREKVKWPLDDKGEIDLSKIIMGGPPQIRPYHLPVCNDQLLPANSFIIIKDWSEHKADLVVGEIPINIRDCSDHIESLCRKFKFNYGEYFCINQSLSKTRDKGRALFSIPLMMLGSKGKESAFRASLLEDDILDAVIQLPKGMYNPSYSGETAILIFDDAKAKDRKNKVLFINASDLLFSDMESDIAKIADVYWNYQEADMFSRIVAKEEIIKNKANLIPGSYIGPIREAENIVGKMKNPMALKDVAKIVNGKTSKDKADNPENRIAIVQIADLKKDIQQKKLDAGHIGSLAVLPDKSRFLEEKCILISKIGSELRPTIFDPVDKTDESRVAIDNNIIALIPGENLSLDYLYYILYDREVKAQLEIISLKGTRYSILRPTDIAKIKIPVPALAEQDAYIRNEKPRLIESEISRSREIQKRISVAAEAAKAEKDIMSVLAHNTLPDITNMELDISRLESFISKKGLQDEILWQQKDESGDEDDDLIDDQLLQIPDEKISETIENIKKRLNKFETVISRTREIVQVNIQKKDFRIVSLREVFLSIKHEYDSESLFKIVIKGRDIQANIHLETFREMIRNLIRNAENHAFRDKSRKYRIIFEIHLTEDERYIEIAYENNGIKFEIPKEDFISAGRKRSGSDGDGLGGYYINKVIKAHDGELRIDYNHPGMKIMIRLPYLEE